MPDEATNQPVRVYAPSRLEGFDQGEVVSGLGVLKPDVATLGSSDVLMIQVEYPHAVILTQACDLEWDYNLRRTAKPTESEEKKRLRNILLCPADLATQAKASAGGSDLWRRIQQNKDERYHFLEAVPAQDDLEGVGVPALCLDFKHYVTVPTDEMYERLKHGLRRRSTLEVSYKAHLSARFAYYQARVGLPRDHSPLAAAAPALPPPTGSRG